MVREFRKKPVVVRALQWTGSNDTEVVGFVGYCERYSPDRDSLVIHTLEGDHECKVGDFIIQGVKGEFYPCKPDIFERTYDPA